MLLVCGALLAGVWNRPSHRAVIAMTWGVILVWVAGGGGIQWHWRDFWLGLADRVRMPWGVKFVLGAIVMALVEEAVTTVMTNAAPLFGVKRGEAYITASSNYLDVVLHHSVVAFIPLFIGWAVILSRWRFSPFAVFVLFGITGTLAETLTFGPQNLGNAGFWILVYGLMVWLPAHFPPPNRSARDPKWYLYPLAVVIPFLFMPLLAVIAPWLWLFPGHPHIHFPPITGP
jgi:hypothetical protein